MGVMKKIIVILALVLLGGMFVGAARQGTLSRVSSPAAGQDAGGKIAYVRSNLDSAQHPIGGAIWLYQGGEQHQLTKGPKDKQDKRDSMPAFSPDGSQLTYVRFDEGYSDLYQLSLDSPGTSAAITHNRPPADVEVGAVDPNGRRGWSDLALWALYPSYSPDGRNIAYTTDIGIEYPGLYLMTAKGANSHRISWLDHSQQTVERPSWSPDGTKIAVANYVDTKGVGQIWILNLEAGKWTAVTESKDGAYDPAWSPDGQWIAFTMRDGASHDIYIVPSDPSKWEGVTATPVKITSDGAARLPTWSPDGTKLAYISLKDGSFDLYTATFEPNPDPALTNPQKLTDKANIDAAGGLAWGR